MTTLLSPQAAVRTWRDSWTPLDLHWASHPFCSSLASLDGHQGPSTSPSRGRRRPLRLLEPVQNTVSQAQPVPGFSLALSRPPHQPGLSESTGGHDP